MTKVAFLFGAGAEGKGNYNIKSGSEYFKATLFPTMRSEKVEEALKGYFSMPYFNGNYKYTVQTFDATNYAFKSFIMYRAVKNESFLSNWRDDIQRILNEGDLKYVAEELEINNTFKHVVEDDPTFKEKIKFYREEFKRALLNSEKVQTDFVRQLLNVDSAERTKIENDLVSAGLLESHFHTIISPPKFGKVKFSKIFNYYWHCYFSIVEDVLALFFYKGIAIDNNYFNDNGLNYEYILNNIGKFTEYLYSLDLNQLNIKDSYYQLFRKFFYENKDIFSCSGVITTNYYRFCELLYDDPIYLHGKINVFEKPETLEIVENSNVSRLNKSELFFPFIFGQSYVKPIVCSQQISEYKRFCEVLNDSDILIVLGFNFNNDDNHISSFIREFVKKNKKLIVVTSEENDTLYKRIRLNENEFEVVKVNYDNNESVVGKIIERIFSSVNNGV